MENLRQPTPILGTNYNYNTPVYVTLFANRDPFVFNAGDYFLITSLFPSPSYKINNYEYLALRHQPSHLMVARVIVDLRFRMAGKTIPKGFTVEYVNKNKSDLRFGNLRIVSTKDKHRKNGFGAHHALDIRLSALTAGSCPDAAVVMRIKKGGET